MRYVRTLGLCVIAALAAMAVIGAASASATRLCPENTSPCPSPYKKGTSIKATLAKGSKAVFSSGFVTIECTESAISGKTTSEGGAGAAVLGSISSVTWKGCTTTTGGACTTSALFTPWAAEVTGSGGSGTMTVKNVGGKFTCAVTCEYEAKSASLSASGGGPATIKASSISFSKIGGSFLCSSTASWSATYEVTAPNPLFVVSE